MRRIERLINLIAALLDARSPMTAEAIRTSIAGYDQDDYNSFRRTFERDKEALRNLGIPLETKAVDAWAGSAEGYIISKDKYYLPELDLEPDELAALGIAAHSILGGREDADIGVLKLSVDSVLEPPSAARVLWGANIGTDEPLLGRIYQALLDRHPVSFTYGTGEGRAHLRTVEPYGLVHRRGHWYLVGRSVEPDAMRSFRLSRIEPPVRVEQGSYEIPQDFDPGAHLTLEPWELGTEEPSVATVRFDPDMRWVVEQNMPGATTRPGPDGALDVDLQVSNVEALVSWVLRLGPGVEVLSPRKARAAVVARLKQYDGAQAG